jgi:hypothetical protein
MAAAAAASQLGSAPTAATECKVPRDWKEYRDRLVKQEWFLCPDRLPKNHDPVPIRLCLRGVLVSGCKRHAHAARKIIDDALAKECEEIVNAIYASKKIPALSVIGTECPGKRCKPYVIAVSYSRIATTKDLDNTIFMLDSDMGACIVTAIPFKSVST